MKIEGILEVNNQFYSIVKYNIAMNREHCFRTHVTNMDVFLHLVVDLPIEDTPVLWQWSDTQERKEIRFTAYPPKDTEITAKKARCVSFSESSKDYREDGQTTTEISAFMGMENLSAKEGLKELMPSRYIVEWYDIN